MFVEICGVLKNLYVVINDNDTVIILVKWWRHHDEIYQIIIGSANLFIPLWYGFSWVCWMMKGRWGGKEVSQCLFCFPESKTNAT